MKIKAGNINKTLGYIDTLDNVSINLQENEFVVILGPSGCGKSTLFNIIAGLISPDQGYIEIDGEDYTGRTGRVGYMQQKDLLLPSRNILGNVAIPLLLKGIERKEAEKTVRNCADEFGLGDFLSYYPRQLSGGMRQRAALLRTYLFASDILLLDEPFASLDAITRRNMHIWLMHLRQHYKSSVLFVTHDIEEAILLGDRIYVLSARPAYVKKEFNLTDIADNETIKLRIKKEILLLLEDAEDAKIIKPMADLKVRCKWGLDNEERSMA